MRVRTVTGFEIELTDAELRAVICALHWTVDGIGIRANACGDDIKRDIFGDLRTANAGQRAICALRAEMERRKG